MCLGSFHHLQTSVPLSVSHISRADILWGHGKHDVIILEKLTDTLGILSPDSFRLGTGVDKDVIMPIQPWYVRLQATG